MTQIGRMAGLLNIGQPAPLTNWVSIPAVLVTGAYCYAELAVFFPSGGRNHRHGTHCTYPRRDGQAELAWVAGYLMRQFTCPKAVTHPSTNRAQCRATALIETNELPLHQTAIGGVHNYAIEPQVAYIRMGQK